MTPGPMGHAMSQPEHRAREAPMTRETGGGCACGAVRYRVTGPLRPVIACHCESCRRNCPAPVTAFLAVHRDAFRWTGAALAAAVMGFPLMVRAIRLAVEAVDSRLEEAAGTLGAGRIATFMLVTLPLALPGIIAGAVLGFAKAMGEFGATITFVSNIPGETQTLPSAIYSLLQVPGEESGAIRLTVIAILVAVGALIASEVLAQRARKRAEGR